MNKKYKILTCLIFIALIIALTVITLCFIANSNNVNCTAAVEMNSPGDHEYTFHGTISVKIRPGTGMISIFGTSVSARQPTPINKHFVNRDITFKVLGRNKSDFYLSDILVSTHPDDNMTQNESAGLLFDMFDFENKRITIRRLSNSFIIGDLPLPSFICIKKK
ncbi:hypothetical protein [Enterobacter cloacae]|uniref:hypothetical protein n=1 Tax=Enterobacter cloacae TaxID=550 RepID=UPI0034CFB2AB